MNFKHAIVKIPGKSIVNGITTAQLGLPDYQDAVQQHEAYIRALKTCGLRVHVLPPSESFPDSTFVEDVAILTPYCAIITRPGVPSRRGETREIKPLLQSFFNDIFKIKDPGTVEAGDIMMVGTHFYIGLSRRTNQNGALQVVAILNRYGLTGSMVHLEKVLHLKTGVAYLENNNLVACGEFVHHPVFQKFNILRIDEDESYAANCVCINDTVLVPKGYPKAKQTIEVAGYQTIELEMSEYKKLDGGLSCLSLRF